MTVPSFTKDLDGILAIGGVIPNLNGTTWAALIAPDGSGHVISINPNGDVEYVPPGDYNPYNSFIVSPDGQKASVMPLRSGGPLPGARWWHYGLIVVPTTGL